MKKPVICTVCIAEQETGVLVDTSRPKTVWAEAIGVTEASIRRHLKHPPRTSAISDACDTSGKPEVAPERVVSTSEDSSGGFGADWIRNRALTIKDAEDWVRSAGKDPADYEIGVTTNAYGLDQWSNKLSARPKKLAKGEISVPNADELIKSLENYKPTVTIKKGFTKRTFVLVPADAQIGKVDWNGNTDDTIAQMLDSYAAAARFCAEKQFDEIVIADAGDPVENIYSVSSQRGTNDKSITEQIRIARRIALEGIKMLAPLTPKLTYLAVPSNHGSVRVGPKSPENAVLDDYGIEIAEQLRDVCANSDRLQNVQVIIPEFNHESLVYTTSGTVLGLVHGHQVNTPDTLGKWWQGQSHGRMPTGEADILLVGHWHQLRVQQSGDERWILVSPAQDRGSSWYTNKTGNRSTSGMLSFTTADGQWDDLRIL